LNPTLGHEERGRSYLLALSVEEFNRLGLCLVAPIDDVLARAKTLLD